MVVSENEIGLREARAKIGELVNQAEYHGTTTYITRHGRRVAAIVPAQKKETNMKTIYAVVHEGRARYNAGQQILYAFYATRSLADAVVDAIRERRVPKPYWYNNPRVLPMEVHDPFDAATYATYATFGDPNSLDYLVIDPDGQFPHPDKLDADGWWRA